MSLRDQFVQFKVCNIFIPDPRALLWELHADDLLKGRVIDLSDSGPQEDVFAVIEVEGIKQPVIVPVKEIVPVSE
ncbi:MAG TPA: hypothetical protein VJS44_10365 [Pyrinomonadaceae bacterium]|nr:hypothetical protein [Pyrinomonadaceae bacterium]